MQVNVVVGGENERLLLGPAGRDELLEAPVLDAKLGENAVSLHRAGAAPARAEADS